MDNSSDENHMKYAIKKGLEFLEGRCGRNGFQYDSLGTDCNNFQNFHGKFTWPLENELSIFALDFIGHLLSSTSLKLLTEFAEPSTGPKEINHFVNTEWVPNDVENTAFRISYFLNQEIFSIKDTLKMAEVCISNIIAETGEIQVYLPPRGRREGRFDYTASCHAMRFLYQVGMRDKAIQTEKGIWNFLTSGAYLKGSRYYPAPEAFLCFCARAVVENPVALEKFKEPLFIAIKERLHELLLLKCRQSKPINIALLILGLSSLDKLQDVGVGYLIQNAKLQLIAFQNQDGSWPKATLYCAPNKSLYPGAHEVSNIFCVAALNSLKSINQ